MKKYLFLLGIVMAMPLGYSQSKDVLKKELKEKISTHKSLTTEVPVDKSVKIGKLSNGLTYYIKQNAKPENKVELRLVVNAGSVLEDEDQKGLAHFMEHMCFNGTKNFKKNELVDYLQSIGVKFGAHLNAYTSFDETVYILPIPSENPEELEKGFQILEDWAHNALLTDEQIDSERGVVLEEYRLGKGADERMLQKYLPKVLYGSKYAERLPIGTKENLENFKYESLRRFYKEWYRPDLMAVMAVGDVDVAVLEEKIKSHFGKIPAVKNPRPREIVNLENHDETFIAIETDKEASFANIKVMFKDIENYKPSTSVEDFRKSVVKGLFSQMLNNRLDELRNAEKPPFVYGYSYHGGTWARTKEAFQSIAMSSPTGQLEALNALLEENEKVKRFGFNNGEFERAKKSILSRYEKMFKDKDKTESGRIIGEYVRNFLEGEVIPGIEWEYNFYKKTLPTIKIEEVNKVIKNYLRDSNRVIVLTGPEKEGFAKVTEKEVLAVIENVNKKDLKPYEDKKVASSLIKELPEAGAIANVVKDEKLGTVTVKLSNGATIIYKKTDFKNDEILFEAFSFGGTSLYSDDEIKTIGYANGGLAEAGVGGFSKTDLGKMMSGKIVRLRPRISSYSEGLSGSTTPKDLEELFQLTHLYFTKLNKDDKAYNSFVAKQKGFLSNMLSNPSTYFQNEMGKFMYGENPRYLGFPTAEKMDASNYDLAYQKYQERFSDAGDFNFYFVGNIDERKFIEYGLKYIGSLPSKNSNENYKVPSFRPLSGSHEKIVEIGEDPKSMVQIIFQGEAVYNNKEAHAMSSLGEILSIKLVEKLREEEGGVYGVGARGNINKTPYGWYSFRISFPCGPENVDKLKTIALKELQEIIENGPTTVDLDKIKEAQLLEHKENLKKNRFWLGYLKNSDYNKSDLQRVFEVEKNTNDLTKLDIQNVAKKYLADGYILGVQNPKK